MPPLLNHQRRTLITLLVLSGFGQAAASICTALAVPALLSSDDARQRWVLVPLLLCVAVIIGALRVAERVLSERLGQSYVTELRSALIGAALGSARGPNLGITVARTTNDLSSIRNWLALGISPLLTGVPLILAVIGTLIWLDPPIGSAVAIVLLGLSFTLLMLSRPALRRSRALRKRRGRMAAHIADTVTASAGIRAAGGTRRELRKIDSLSSKVAQAAVARAVISGSMRGIAAATATAAMVCTAIVGALAHTPMPDMTTALLLIGVIATPISDLGRIGEYRQAYNAACLVISPVLHRAADSAADEQRTRESGTARRASAVPPGTVHIADLAGMPELLVHSGDRILLNAASDEHAAQIIGALLNGSDAAWVQVDGYSLHALPANRRRELVGWAARGTALERGTIARAVRYRLPSSSQSPADTLRRVGLDSVVAQLDDADRTVLRRGGEPLTLPDRARLLSARAVFGNPPLLVLDHIDAQLDSAGRGMLAALVRRYPGVVIARTDRAEEILGEHRDWQCTIRPGTSTSTPAHLRGDRI